MNLLLKKLQFKNQKEIFVINHPEEFKDFLHDFETYTTVATEISKTNEDITFIIVFVKSLSEIEIYIEKIKSLLNADTNLWFSYPKKSSKKYKSDINRDKGWQALGKISFEPVRQIAIDDDWSALRFRHISQIKSFKRNKNMALSEEGRNPTKKTI